jgi:hypothetical protein
VVFAFHDILSESRRHRFVRMSIVTLRATNPTGFIVAVYCRSTSGRRADGDALLASRQQGGAVRVGAKRLSVRCRVFGYIERIFMYRIKSGSITMTVTTTTTSTAPCAIVFGCIANLRPKLVRKNVGRIYQECLTRQNSAASPRRVGQDRHQAGKLVGPSVCRARSVRGE